MHKCIMVKIGGKEKCKLSKKGKLNENRGTFIKFVETGGDYTICIIGLGGMGALDLLQTDSR